MLIRCFLFPFDLDEGLDGGNRINAGVVVEVGELDEEDELLDLDFVLLAGDTPAHKNASTTFALKATYKMIELMSSD